MTIVEVYLRKRVKMNTKIWTSKYQSECIESSLIYLILESLQHLLCVLQYTLRQQNSFRKFSKHQKYTSVT